MVLTRTDLEDIKKVIGAEVRAIFVDQFKTELVEAISKGIEDKFNAKFKDIRSELESTRTELRLVQVENQDLRRILDTNEQHSRIHNLRIFGLKCTEGENLSTTVLHLFKNTMKIESANSIDIKKCQRVSAKKPSPDRPPAVLVEFANVNIRSEVFSRKKCLINSGISIKEDLTQYRLKLLNAAVSKFTIKNAWCLHGNIYIRSAGVVHRIRDESDIQRLNP